MNYRIQVLIACILSLFSLYAQASQNEPLSPKTTIIMFDVDDVILVRPAGGIKKIIWDNRWVILKNPRLVWKMFQLYRSGNAAGGDYLHLCQKENNKEMARFIERITLDKSLNPGIAEFIKQLKDEGFTLHVASNMSRDNFDYFMKRFPEIFSLFDCVKVLEYNGSESPAKKPYARYYQEYLQQCPSDKKRLFFDDREDNIAGAQRMGIDGIVFRTPEQAKAEFEKRRADYVPSCLA